MDVLREDVLNTYIYGKNTMGSLKLQRVCLHCSLLAKYLISKIATNL